MTELKQNVIENFEDGQKEASQSQGSGKKIDGEAEEQSICIPVPQTLGIKRKVEEF